MDEERDRRFKAEQAARKLVEHLKLLEQKGTRTKGAAWIANKPINFLVSEQQQQQETVLVKLSQLQLILRQEKQNRANFQDQYEKTRVPMSKSNVGRFELPCSSLELRRWKKSFRCVKSNWRSIDSP